MTDNLPRAAGHAVAAAAAFAVVGACIKAASASMPNEVVVFFRNAVALLVLLPWLLKVRIRGLYTQRLGGHLLRAGFGVAAMYCFFYALHHLNLAEAVLLNYSAPLFIPLIAWAWIKETPPWIILPAGVLGLVGIGLIVKPEGTHLISLPAAVGALSGVLAAAAMVSIRRISRSEPTPRIVFYFSGLATIISAVPLLWAWQTPGPAALLAMIGAGLFATIGQLSLTQAYSLAPAARIGAITYCSVIFAALLGWLIWDETPDRRAALGAVLVIGTCILATLRSRARPNPVTVPRQQATAGSKSD